MSVRRGVLVERVAVGGRREDDGEPCQAGGLSHDASRSRLADLRLRVASRTDRQRDARRPQPPIHDGELRAELRTIAKAHPRWGYKMATRVVRRKGWHVNRKRVQRLWRAEGLKRPPQGRKRRRVRLDTTERMRAGRPNHVWATGHPRRP